MRFAPPSALRDLRALRAPGGRGLYTSLGPLFSSAVFGRDSLEVAEDLVDSERELVREILLMLAYLQGTEENEVTEERRGRIHHEYRRDRWDGVLVSPSSRAILSQLAKQWGGSEHEMIYYGSADATPLFCRVLDRYSLLYGPELLNSVFRRRNGEETTMRASLALAVSYIIKTVEASPYGLYDFCHTNPKSILYQVWKDSRTGIVHPQGELANAEAPIATVELQGLAYDALKAGERWLSNRNAERCRLISRELAHRTVEILAADDGTFHCAVDVAPLSGRQRVVKTCTSDQGTLLRSGLFDELSSAQRKHLIQAITELICGPRFLTAAGVRCRAVEYSKLMPWPDYHGTNAVWSKETYDIARGLDFRGYHHLAAALENRLLEAAVRAGGHYEFFWVFPGGVVYRPEIVAANAPVVEVSNFGEPGQAWVVSAVLAIKRRRVQTLLKHKVSAHEAQVLRGMPLVPAPQTALSCPLAPVRLQVASVDIHLSAH